MEIINTNQPGFMARLKPILERGKLGFRAVEDQVKEIIAQVRERGDEALLEYTRRFDKLTLLPSELAVTPAEIEAARQEVSSEQLDALKLAAGRIRNYHQRQVRQPWFMNEEEGVILGQLIRPLERVGVYVPGGKAAYPSSVLMNVIPAQVAGVEDIIICSPANPEGKLNPFVLAAADLLKISRIYRVGGAQAIAALAYGTETIPRVDKIAGPGNIYVAAAKRLLYGEVGIDMVAGPSEILVIADESARASFIAADLLSQAEHDELACGILLTPSASLAQAVALEVERQLAELSRREIAARSWEQYGAIVVTKDIDEAISIANRIAPEHLELALEKPQAVLDKVRHAGAIFLGHYTPEAIGDYLAGPNHVLPTGGSARFASPLGVDDFIKKTSLIGYSAQALKKQAPTAVQLAQMEGLSAHLKAIKQRLNWGRKVPSPLGERARVRGGNREMKRDNIEKARYLRKNQTDTERKLWSILRKRQLAGVKFRRQVPIGKYIVDFYSPEYKLAIEADGGQHYEDKGKQRDDLRTRELSDLGVQILRFSNLEILNNLEGVCEIVLKTIEEKSPPSP